MGGLVVQLFLTIIVVLGLAAGGMAAGLGVRAAARVRALAASALLLTAIGYGVLLLAGGLDDRHLASGLSFLALFGGVVLGALVAVIACAAGLTHAALEHDQRWLRVLLVGSLLPLLLSVILVSVEQHVVLPPDATRPTQQVIMLLIVTLALAALGPLAPLIYGAWAAHREAHPSEAALAALDS